MQMFKFACEHAIVALHLQLHYKTQATLKSLLQEFGTPDPRTVPKQEVASIT